MSWPPSGAWGGGQGGSELPGVRQFRPRGFRSWLGLPPVSCTAPGRALPCPRAAVLATCTYTHMNPAPLARAPPLPSPALSLVDLESRCTSALQQAGDEERRLEAIRAEAAHTADVLATSRQALQVRVVRPPPLTPPPLASPPLAPPPASSSCRLVRDRLVPAARRPVLCGSGSLPWTGRDSPQHCLHRADLYTHAPTNKRACLPHPPTIFRFQTNIQTRAAGRARLPGPGGPGAHPVCSAPAGEAHGHGHRGSTGA